MNDTSVLGRAARACGACFVFVGVAALFLAAPSRPVTVANSARSAAARERIAVRDRVAERSEQALTTVLRRAVQPEDPRPQGGPDLDALTYPEAVFLRDHPIDAADAALLPLLAARSLRRELRVEAIVAMCRPGHVAARDRLVPVVLDHKDDEAVRRVALERLPLIGEPLPPSLRQLLFAPWFELDVLAGVVLAASGDPEAPSIVRRAVNDAAYRAVLAGRWMWNREVISRAAVCTARGDASVSAAADSLRSLAPEAWDGRAWQVLLGALDAWLAAHPEARRTEFERALARDPDAAARRDRWLRRTPEEIAALPDDEIDVAGAICVLTMPEDQARDTLEALDRLAAGLRADVEAASTPSDKIRVLERAIPVRYRKEGDPDCNSLATVIHAGDGNCMGWTTLWVVLGQRLGLPFRAVEIPWHVFPRWDDGTTCINIEATQPGLRRTDHEYLRASDTGTTTPGSGRWLRSLGQREFVSIALVIRASAVRARSVGDARRLAEIALRVDPSNFGALLWKAAFLPTDAADEAASCLRRYLKVPDLTAFETSEVLRQLRARGFADEALRAFDAAVRRWPEDAGLRLVYGEELLTAGRAADAVRTLGSLPDPIRATVSVRALEVAALAASGDSYWRFRLSAGESNALREPWLRLDAARHLLDVTPRTREAAAMVLEMLEPLAPLGDALAQDADAKVRGLAQDALIAEQRDRGGWSASRTYLWYRGAALARLDRTDEAREAKDRAARAR